MHLALTGLFRAKWSADIHEEWITALLRNRPDLTRTKLERTRMLMDQHATDALVTDYQHLMPGLQLPDPDDRHVLAAAIRARADVIITINLRDFPPQAMAPFGIEAQHPDEFILHLLDLAPGVVAGAARDHRLSLKSPAKTIEEYLNTLEVQGLTQTVSVLREYVF
jgi:predicted nucleic acid-binding protein